MVSEMSEHPLCSQSTETQGTVKRVAQLWKQRPRSRGHRGSPNLRECFCKHSKAFGTLQGNSARLCLGPQRVQGFPCTCFSCRQAVHVRKVRGVRPGASARRERWYARARHVPAPSTLTQHLLPSPCTLGTCCHSDPTSGLTGSRSHLSF